VVMVVVVMPATVTNGGSTLMKITTAELSSITIGETNTINFYQMIIIIKAIAQGDFKMYSNRAIRGKCQTC